MQKEHIEEKYNQYVNDVVSIQYKIKKNDEKFAKIEKHIHYLDEELKSSNKFLIYLRFYQERIIKNYRKLCINLLFRKNYTSSKY